MTFVSVLSHIINRHRDQMRDLARLRTQILQTVQNGPCLHVWSPIVLRHVAACLSLIFNKTVTCSLLRLWFVLKTRFEWTQAEQKEPLYSSIVIFQLTDNFLLG